MNTIKNAVLIEQMIKKNTENEHPFTIEEMKWAAQSTADFYERLEKGEVQPFKERQ